MSTTNQYAIRGGVAGRERLRVLSRTMHPGTTALFERLNIGDGLTCLDVGCGGGDVTLKLARRVAPAGRVVGVDVDETKLDFARREAGEAGLGNVEYRLLDIRTGEAGTDFDVVYARFLLSHLADPARVLGVFHRHLCPGGLVVVEDVDFSGSFTWPELPAFQRYQELYSAVVQKRGGNANLGPQLPILLADAGFEQVGLHVVQPVATEGEAKLLNPLTMENIADAVLQDGLASREELDEVVRQLYDFAANPRTVAGAPRVVQTWGRRAGF
ncbi:MAG: methyltransferase domain-containing protein [Sphingobacteriaceae bacterium]|nr:methyltransferase domain-containing protein [Cytophagaceae bacterium]